MFSRLFNRTLFGALVLLLAGTSLRAQTIPSPAQAQQMLRTDPTLLTRLQQMLQQGQIGEGSAGYAIRA